MLCSEHMVAVAVRVAVLIGADALAVEEIVRHLPSGAGLSVLVAVDGSRQLAKRLRDSTALPIVEVTQTVPLETDRVYVLPKHAVTVAADKLSIDEGTTEISRDRLLRSVADAFGPECAAVILRGRGADGVLGAKRVKEAGGITICQQASGGANELPRLVSANSMIDLTLPADAIARRLVDLTQSELAKPDAAGRPTLRPEDEPQFDEILGLLLRRTGLDFHYYDAAVVRARLVRRALMCGAASLAAYRRLVQDQPSELTRLFRELLICVSDFFRERSQFDVLAADIVPRLFSGKRVGESIRVWVPGCATGEEAYSLAMLLCEEAARKPHPPRLQVFATDLEEEALREARVGIYPDTIAADIEEYRLARFFTREQEHYRVADELRDITMFAKQNMLADPPFSHLDMICCRGVLHNLVDVARERVLDGFHFALKPGGMLVVGLGETIDSPQFVPHDRAGHIYRRVTPAARKPQPTTPPLPAATIEQLHAEVLQHHAPLRLLLDGELRVVHHEGDASRFFQGSALLRPLVPLLHPALAPVLRGAIYAARMTEHRSVRRIARFEDRTARHDIEVRVTALEPDAAAALLVELRNIDDDDDDPRAIADLAATNEELMVMNEELRVGTRQLEHNRDKLTRLNEQLVGLNKELTAGIGDVEHSVGALEEVLNRVGVAALFLDDRLVIERFTPRLPTVLPIHDSDVGRPLANLVPGLDVSLAELARDVLAGGAEIDRSVVDATGKRHRLRIARFGLGGLLLTFLMES